MKSIDIPELTNTILSKLNPNSLRLKSAFRSLCIYELFGKIIENRGSEFIVNFDLENELETKESILNQLESSLNSMISIESVIHKEVFYLGLICGTLVHINMEVPSEFDQLGDYSVSADKIDA